MTFFGRILWCVALLGLFSFPTPTLAGGGTTGCVDGSGHLETVQRRVAPVEAVVVDGAFEVVFVFGKKADLSLTAEGNLLPQIVTEVKDGTLYIHPRRSICATEAIKVRMGVESLSRVVSQGANDLWFEEVAGGDLHVVIEGSGDVRASGRARRFSADIRGAADLMSKDLKADTVTIDISGAGDAEVFASKGIDVNISGAGTVIYHGRPPRVTEEISGAGELIAR